MIWKSGQMMLYFKELCRRIADLSPTIRIMSGGSSEIVEIFFGGREGKWMFQTENLFFKILGEKRFLLSQRITASICVWLYPKPPQHFCERGFVSIAIT